LSPTSTSLGLASFSGARLAATNSTGNGRQSIRAAKKSDLQGSHCQSVCCARRLEGVVRTAYFLGFEAPRVFACAVGSSAELIATTGKHSMRVKAQFHLPSRLRRDVFATASAETITLGRLPPPGRLLSNYAFHICDLMIIDIPLTKKAMICRFKAAARNRAVVVVARDWLYTLSCRRCLSGRCHGIRPTRSPSSPLA
jgi:hypothetical protein